MDKDIVEKIVIKLFEAADTEEMKQELLKKLIVVIAEAHEQYLIDSIEKTKVCISTFENQEKQLKKSMLSIGACIMEGLYEQLGTENFMDAFAALILANPSLKTAMEVWNDD